MIETIKQILDDCNVHDTEYTITLDGDDGCKVTWESEVSHGTENMESHETEAEFAIRCALAMTPTMTWTEFMDRHEDKIYYEGEMGEPGYDYDWIFLGDWWIRSDSGLNDYRDTPKFIVDVERARDTARWVFEFDDEWSACMSCNKIYRSTHDSYSWKSQCAFTHTDEWVCQECLNEHPETAKEFLQFLENEPSKCLLFDWDLEDYGYVQFNGRYQNGLHRHMNDDPNQIMKHLHHNGFDHVLFKVPSVSQFYVNFETYVRKSEVSLWYNNQPIQGTGVKA